MGKYSWKKHDFFCKDSGSTWDIKETYRGNIGGYPEISLGHIGEIHAYTCQINGK